MHTVTSWGFCELSNSSIILVLCVSLDSETNEMHWQALKTPASTALRIQILFYLVSKLICKSSNYKHTHAVFCNKC